MLADEAQAAQLRMRWRLNMPRFDWHKERPLTKLAALARTILPPTLWGLAALMKVLR